MRISLITLIFILLTPIFSFSQELDCSVRVNSRQVQGTDKQVFTTMQKAIFEFMNNTKWTGYNIKVQERIECTILFTITSRPSADEFIGRLNVVLRRPVFNTSYSTPLFNWVDNDVHFKYLEHEPIEFSENTYTSNLASICSFYAYLMIGLDFDSYSKFGGAPYFEKAQTIVSVAQNGNEKGWNSFDSQKNRYWLAENLLNNSYAGIRQASYLYHLKGLDKMQDNTDMGRSKITEAIELLQRVNEQRPNLFILKLFLEAKSDEIVNIYKKGSNMDKTKVVNILKDMDPANASEYQKILQNN
ncbi:MAG: DUF4835 family protein [Bacteroidota bacterium]|nr:DUF4835 family protein [Bacteroidota bacterium]